MDETLVGVSGGYRIKGSTMGDVGHGLGVYWRTWVGSGSWVWSTLKDSDIIYYLFDKCVLGGEIVFFCGHM